MPELPDIELYLASLRDHILGAKLKKFRLLSLFVLRTVMPRPQDLEGLEVIGLRRIGKRVVIEFENKLFVVIHLMIAGRLRWVELGGKLPPGKLVSAAMEFENGTVALTEAGTKKRASISIIAGEDALKAHDPGGMEVQESSFKDFTEALRAENHTVKLRLTDPHVFAGIGNAYSDEILFRAKISPLKMTNRLDDDEIERLHQMVSLVLREWTEKLKTQFAGRFPGAGEVTAFRPEFAVHGKFGQACPVCGGKVARIRYADNECNYCPNCQNGGRVLADRAMSRLLK